MGGRPPDRDRFDRARPPRKEVFEVLHTFPEQHPEVTLRETEVEEESPPRKPFALAAGVEGGPGGLLHRSLTQGPCPVRLIP